MQQRNHASQRGFTLIEMLIVACVATILLGGTLQAVTSGMHARELGAAISDTETQVSRTLNRLAWTVTGSGLGTVDPRPAAPASTAGISYQKALDFVGDAIVWGPAGRLEFRLEPNELADGIGNDGNGLVDEGMVVWVENSMLPDETEVIIAHGVRSLLEGELPNGLDDNGNGLIDEPGLCFEINGQTLSIRLSLERIGPDGNSIIRTSETRVTLRNPSS
ncbi:MAG: prepilin-type N-terminal cleavage/methylation domain-containing protein [Planctomycetes bacterium]|nr:prepilin-type N-terminal cleavage/methylation domain-containing protein [Planctomycetota bacterium]MCB9909791.1 prepilin-type N-terminal cleavage/methylation domain-containing protein [Planctomycetota bacterium]MCB9912300.1 prepilin-type N-terminal cleavage/methylation domain-containing protein [Planctomycetota bacterium]HPF12739.1 prepilin-type N-terminal cleavage/methylation domain-containing protein [Planctomycetota bacterium]HRV82805.1 prepilin-type N-terminal cleavage/methylation domain